MNRINQIKKEIKIDKMAMNLAEFLAAIPSYKEIGLVPMEGLEGLADVDNVVGFTNETAGGELVLALEDVTLGPIFDSIPKVPDAVLVFGGLAVSVATVSISVGDIVEESKPELFSVPLAPGAVLTFEGMALDSVGPVAGVIGDEVCKPELVVLPIILGAVLVFGVLVAVSPGTVSAPFAPVDDVTISVTSVPSPVLVAP